MSATRYEVFPRRFVALTAAALCLAACGGGGGEGGMGGAGGEPDDGEPMTGGGGGSVATGGSGGGEAGKAGGSGGTVITAGAGGTSNGTGGVAGTAGMAAMGGMAGAAPVGGAIGMVDMTKEKVWIDADITFGSNGSITHNQPNNWFAPIDYYNGSMEVRADVTAAPSGFYGLELCLYKSGPNDAKHDCLPLAYRLMGTGQMLKTHTKTSIILRNFLAQGTVSEDDFKTPWAANNTRLVGSEHAMTIAGPVKTHLTIVLVPKGYTFSGWSKYPAK
ncbi:MAG: hypothetical protein SF187_12185 [Deltaproteobacteria bacterium]|nr:hypothetical protein [Deltaproteobacteria bacterium]